MRTKITTRNTSVNVAKVVTILCLLALPLFYAVHTRQAAYLALQVSYCVWYLMKQAIMREPVFKERDSLLDAIQVVAIVGVFYALPGWLAFMNPEPVGDAILAASIALFFFGSVINSSADVQKTTALRLREGSDHRRVLAAVAEHQLLRRPAALQRIRAPRRFDLGVGGADHGARTRPRADAEEGYVARPTAGLRSVPVQCSRADSLHAAAVPGRRDQIAEPRSVE